MNAVPGPFVFISIINWNNPQDTLRCLHSLRALDWPNARIVIVDNASRDDSIAQIQNAGADILVVQSNTNLGFSGGHELALRQAQAAGADAIWLLNNDAQVEPEALRELIVAWQRHGDAIYGGLPLCRRRDGSVVLNIPQKFLCETRRPRATGRDAEVEWDVTWQQRPAQRVGAVVGSSFFLPLRLVQKHGWLDASWFMYCEEIDYCYRLKESGVPSYLVPRSILWHRGGGSSRRWPRVEDCIHYYHARNEIELARRHAGRGAAVLTGARKLLRSLWVAPAFPLRARMILRGVRDAARHHMGKTVAPEDYLDGRDNDAPGSRAPRRSWHPGLRGRAFLTSRLTNALRIIVDRLRKPSCTIERIHRSMIAHDPRYPIHIREYYLYCVALFKDRLARSDTALNLVFGDYDVAFGSEMPSRKIDIQFEHTLVRPGGRDSEDALVGKTPLPDGQGCYLVRIQNLAYLRTLDLVIDYSRANLDHVRNSDVYNDYTSRTICLAPLLYPVDFSSTARKEGMITLFADVRQTRRRRFLDAAREAGVPLRNVTRVFDKRELARLYRNTRILVNVHQTDHHHTLEELRVLPALLCGVIVISEDVPLKDSVPYSRFIVWSSHADLLATARAVDADYAYHHQRLFGDPALADILGRLQTDNIEAVDHALQQLLPHPPHRA
ncbi:MAG: glycosyltransferase family 2 protein [Dokdonella sp.]